VFLTSGTTNGNIGGLAAADAICQAAATNQGWAGTYLAFLNTSTQTAASRFDGITNFTRPDGRPLAISVANMLSDQEIFYPPLLDETSTLRDSTHRQHWVGNAADNCNNWTTTSSTARRAKAGSITEWDSWGGSVACTDSRALLCFGANVDTGWTGPSAPGTRLTFVTENGIVAGGGVEDFDAQCQTEYDAVMGAGTGRTVRALVGQGTRSAAGRLTDTTSTSWARPDGVLVAPTAAAFLSGSWDAQVHQQIDGTYNANSATRSAAPTPDTAPTGDCNSWTETTGPSTHGYANYRNWENAYYTSTLTCGTGAYKVHCVEDAWAPLVQNANGFSINPGTGSAFGESTLLSTDADSPQTEIIYEVISYTDPLASLYYNAVPLAVGDTFLQSYVGNPPTFLLGFRDFGAGSGTYDVVLAVRDADGNVSPDSPITMTFTIF
jgi:hypothetical protein